MKILLNDTRKVKSVNFDIDLILYNSDKEVTSEVNNLIESYASQYKIIKDYVSPGGITIKILLVKNTSGLHPDAYYCTGSVNNDLDKHTKGSNGDELLNDLLYDLTAHIKNLL